MDKAQFKRYFEVKKIMKELEEESKILNKMILQDMGDEEIDKAKFEFGTFTVSNKTSYKYSDKVLAIAERLKLAQIREQEKGIAKVVKSNYLTFTPVKIKK